MTEWEYRIINISTSEGIIGNSLKAPEEEKLNEMGKAGWELVMGLPVKDGEITSGRRGIPTD